jgi:multidrug efflux pump subunit AcrA (membrane-fusion protein)
MSLTTERRDAAGNIVRDSDGNPVIVPVAKGMNVVQGQVLGKFDDRELHSILQINQAQLEVARAEREKRIELEHAAHGVQVAHAELNMMRDANSRHANVFPAMEVLRAQLVLSQAEAYLGLQKYNTDEVRTREVIVRESELDRTKVQIELRQLVAPIDGMVVRINAAEGEWLREGHEVLEIMRLDTLWVRVRASVNEYTDSDLYGKQAVIRAALPDGRMETFQGAVFFCDPQIKADNTFDVYIEVQNRRAGNFWLLQPGRADLEVVIQL